MNENETQQLTKDITKTFIAGALARCSAAITMYPIDSIKTRLQFQRETSHKMIKTHYTSGYDAFKRIVKEEGILSLYKGLPIRLVYITPAAAVSFTVYEQFKNAVTKNENHNPSWKAALITLASGGFARILGTACRTPFDILKQQLQVENQIIGEKKGLRVAFKSIVEKMGIKGFFQGYAVTLLRDAPFAGIYFTSYELMKKRVDNLKMKPAQHFLSGAIAGAIATGDVVKTRLQTQSRLGTDEYSGIFDAYKKIYKEEGIRGLHKGLGPRLLYIMPASAMTFTFFEYFKNLLK